MVPEQLACSDTPGLYKVLGLGALGPEPWGLEGAGGHTQRAGRYANRLCLIPRLVLRFCGGEIVLQKGLQILEGRPLLWVQTPGLFHGLVQGCWAAWRAWHVVAMLHLFQHFPVIHPWVGDSALGDEFSEQDPKGPHIGLDGESAKEGSLWGCPLDGEFGPWRDWGRRER